MVRYSRPDQSAEFLGFARRRAKSVLTAYFVLNKKMGKVHRWCWNSWISLLQLPQHTTHRCPPCNSPSLFALASQASVSGPSSPQGRGAAHQYPGTAAAWLRPGLSPRVSLKAQHNTHRAARTGQGFNQCYQKWLISPCFQKLQHRIFTCKNTSRQRGKTSLAVYWLDQVERWWKKKASK